MRSAVAPAVMAGNFSKSEHPERALNEICATLRARAAQRELNELKGIVERGKHRMDQRALDERVKTILKRRWLKDAITVEHDIATGRFTYRTDPDQVEHTAQREWGKRIIFTSRDEWSDQLIVAAYRAQSNPRARTPSARTKTASSSATHQPSTGPTRSSRCTVSTARWH
jgi:hypothetical protein